MRFALFLTLLFVASDAFAGRVTIKRGVASLDGVPVLSWTGCEPRIEGQTCMVHSVASGAPLFTLRQRYHDGWYVFDMNFLDVDKDLRVRTPGLKKFTEDFMTMGVINAEGLLVPENVERYARAYDTTPAIVIEHR